MKANVIIRSIVSGFCVISAALLIAGCTPQPCLTSYEMDKFGNVVVEDCEVERLPQYERKRDRDRTPPVVIDDGPTVTEVERTKGNNGWGNGDQDAPGNSGPNNNAENAGGS